MKLEKRNEEALLAYCDVLLVLRGMQDKDNLARPKNELSPTNSVINRMISRAIRNATDSAHPFGYSDSGKDAAQYDSEDALKQKERGKTEGLICEHVIPISVLRRHILDGWADWKREELFSCFLAYSITAVVTEKENKRLKEEGLHQVMPPGKTISDKFSRYEFADIRLKERDVARQNDLSPA